MWSFTICALGRSHDRRKWGATLTTQILPTHWADTKRNCNLPQGTCHEYAYPFFFRSIKWVFILICTEYYLVTPQSLISETIIMNVIQRPEKI
jgi:hypothetical protein